MDVSEGMNGAKGEGLDYGMIQRIIAGSPAPILDHGSSRLLWSLKGILTLTFTQF